ncbi:MAG: T9SS type A sorting domain-containing protein [Melioribacter sp.]|nr:T9SS type A sorting domain-containing protein [Melioribacter sp.]
MNKLIKLFFIFNLLIVTIISAQEAYWTETFDDTSKAVPRSSPGPNTPTSYKLTLSGEWIFLGVYLGGSTNACGTITATSRTLRMPKISTVQGAGIEPPCYAITPKLEKGIGKLTFKEGRGGINRVVSVYKSADDGKTWTLVAKTDQGTTKCQEITLVINDPAANRIKFANETDGGDLDIEDVTITKAVSTNVDDLNIPLQFTLFQNYPNPFNPTTTINFTLPKMSYVKLTVYNSLGEKIATILSKQLDAGMHSVNFDASNLPSGTYFYRLEADNFISTKKMTLIK